MPELPLEIWKNRIENEIKSLKSLNVIDTGSIVQDDNEVKFLINLKALGFVMESFKEGIDIVPQKAHQIHLELNRAFPYPGGIRFSWQSNIFHPNIHPAKAPSRYELGTGYICLNILKKWSRLTDLETTVKALQKLVENPNPDDPLKYDICLEAANFFKQNTMEDLITEYNIEVEEEEEEKDDIVIID
ncbi:MAG: ubiquitin-conjugating enzyme E2 [Candidatus Thorarchaeota archaeon]